MTRMVRMTTSLLSAGKGTRMMKMMMIIVPLSPAGSSPISGEQKKGAWKVSCSSPDIGEVPRRGDGVFDAGAKIREGHTDDT